MFKIGDLVKFRNDYRGVIELAIILNIEDDSGSERFSNKELLFFKIYRIDKMDILKDIIYEELYKY